VVGTQTLSGLDGHMTCVGFYLPKSAKRIGGNAQMKHFSTSFQSVWLGFVENVLGKDKFGQRDVTWKLFKKQPCVIS